MTVKSQIPDVGFRFSEAMCVRGREGLEPDQELIRDLLIFLSAQLRVQGRQRRRVLGGQVKAGRALRPIC